MLKQYEAMRDKFSRGAPVDSPQYNKAQSKAARIYNARRKPGQRPVSGLINSGRKK